MDILTTAFVILGFSALLLIVGRSYERKRMKAEVMLMEKDNSVRGLSDHRSIVDIQPASGNLIENLLTRVQAKSQAKTDEEMLKAVSKRDELLSAWTSLKNEPTRSAIETRRLQADLMKADDEVERLKADRARRSAEAEAAKRPAIVSKADSIRAENESLRAEAEQLELQMKLDELKARRSDMANAAQPVPTPEKTINDPHEEAMRGLRRRLFKMLKEQEGKEIKEELLVYARLCAKEIGIDVARAEREAKKFYEDYFRR